MPASMKRTRSPSISVVKTEPLLDAVSPQKSKKQKLLSAFSSQSPFPDHAHPTSEEARDVHAVLSKAHPSVGIRAEPVDSNNAAQTCGKVPNVIESLIGTILSQNTSCRNSTAAKQSLDKVFGRNNFSAIVSASRAEVVEAIKHGGLANRKAGTIQRLLEEIKAKHGDYSLQYLSEPGITDEQVMSELVSYDGVGPKTAACVLAFCLGRDAFAVDTHVFRLSKLLGWVPTRATGGIDRVRAQAHLELRIPAELKYSLHVLMVHHGRVCSGCGPAGRGGGVGACILKTYLREKKGVKTEVIDAQLQEANKDNTLGTQNQNQIENGVPYTIKREISPKVEEVAVALRPNLRRSQRRRA